MRHGTSTKLVRGALGLVLVALALPAAAPAADPWPRDGLNAFNTRDGGNNAPSASRAYNLTKVWSRTFDAPVVGTPIIADNGAVYVATEKGEVYALLRTSGVKYWEQSALGQIEASPLKVGETIYVVASNSSGAHLVALTAGDVNGGGEIRFRTRIDGHRDADACGAPQYSATHNAVIVGLGACRAERANRSSTMRGGVVSVDATTGAINWKTSTVSPLATGGGVSSTPVVWDGGDKAFVTTGHAYGGVADPNADAFLQLNLTTGAIEQSYSVHPEDTSNNSVLDVQRRLGFTSPPIGFQTRGGNVFLGAGAQDGKYHLVNALSMTPASSTTLALPGSAAGIAAASAWDSRNQRIYGVTQTPAAFFSLSPDEGGAVKWLFPGTDVAHRGPVSIGGTGIWSTDTTGFLTVQWKTDGHLLGGYPLGAPSVGGISFYRGQAFVAVGAPSGTLPSDAPTANHGAVIVLK